MYFCSKILNKKRSHNCLNDLDDITFLMNKNRQNSDACNKIVLGNL
jgi:hypothetical protein